MFLKKILITIVSLFSLGVFFSFGITKINANENKLEFDKIVLESEKELLYEDAKNLIKMFEKIPIEINDSFYPEQINDTTSIINDFNINITFNFIVVFDEYNYYEDGSFLLRIIRENDSYILDYYDTGNDMEIHYLKLYNDTYISDWFSQNVLEFKVEIINNDYVAADDKPFIFLNEFFDFVNAPFQTILEHLEIVDNSFSLGLGQVQFFEVTIGQFSYWSFSFLVLFLLFRFIYRMLRKLMRSIFGR